MPFFYADQKPTNAEFPEGGIHGEDWSQGKVMQLQESV